MADPLALAIPAFIAGVITFLAPCTLPLVPGYLSFISGNPGRIPPNRFSTILNGIFYVLGFTAVFVLFGTLFGLGGSFLFQYRSIATQIGGVFVVFFGILLIIPALSYFTDSRINLLRLPIMRWFVKERTVCLPKGIKPGNPISSFIFGGVFALGWSPCVGPILGSVLTFAASSATVGQGALLLLLFSLGLAIPFLLVAFFVDIAAKSITRITPYLNGIALLGGVFIVLLGFMMATNNFQLWTGIVFQLFDFLDYEDILLEFL